MLLLESKIVFVFFLLRTWRFWSWMAPACQGHRQEFPATSVDLATCVSPLLHCGGGLRIESPLNFRPFFGSPVIPVTMNYRVEMNAWYDITDSTEKGREDLEGILRSRDLSKSPYAPFVFSRDIPLNPCFSSPSHPVHRRGGCQGDPL